MRLNELQSIVDEWIRANGDYWDEFQILARLTEELGEVAADLQRQAGLRPRPTEIDLEAEVGDLLFTLAVFANKTNIDLARAVERVIKKYNARDAQAWQTKKGQE